MTPEFVDELSERQKKTHTATRNKNKMIKIFSLVAYNRLLSLTPQNPQLVYLFCSLGTIILMSMMFFLYSFFCDPFLEKLYKEPAVRVPSLSRLSEIAKGLGLDMEGSELMAYRGGFLRY